jgi:hypothetical protein
MRRLFIYLLLLSLPTATVHAPAQACSFSWKKGWSPKEIKRRSDVRKVTGVFRLKELKGERRTDSEGTEYVINGEFVGTLESNGGVVRNTIHEAPDDTTTCRYGSYFKPEADAKGTFWISRTKKDGRYPILLWEGEYLMTADAVEKKG